MTDEFHFDCFRSRTEARKVYKSKVYTCKCTIGMFVAVLIDQLSKSTLASLVLLFLSRTHSRSLVEIQSITKTYIDPKMRNVIDEVSNRQRQNKTLVFLGVPSVCVCKT